MAWIEAHDDIWEHYKVLKLCEILKIQDVQAVGHLISLWHFVLRNSWKSADLSAWGDLGIEKAARWRGEPGKFVKALRTCVFLDECKAHGWMERAGRLVYDRFRKEKERSKCIRRLSRTKSGLSKATLPNPTQPNRTVPKLPAKPKTALQEIVDHFISVKYGSNPDKSTVADSYARFSRAVKRILKDLDNDVDEIKRCISHFGRIWENDGKINWGLDAIEKIAWDWKMKQLAKKEKSYGKTVRFVQGNSKEKNGVANPF